MMIACKCRGQRVLFYSRTVGYVLFTCLNSGWMFEFLEKKNVFFRVSDKSPNKIYYTWCTWFCTPSVQLLTGGAQLGTLDTVFQSPKQHCIHHCVPLCVCFRVWEGSMATLGCGWIVILVAGTAVPGQSAPHTAAPSCQLRRTSALMLWRCGLSASLLSRNRLEPNTPIPHPNAYTHTQKKLDWNTWKMCVLCYCYVWQDENKRSILDADPEVQAMMEMAGKTLHSQGLREPEEDDQ